MRVLIVYRRAGSGGIEQAARTLAHSLQKYNHDVHVLTLKGAQDRSKYSSEINLHELEIEKEQRKSVLGFLWYLLSKLLLRFVIPESGFLWKGISSSNVFKNKIDKLESEFGAFDLILIRGQGAFELVWNYSNRKIWYVVESAETGFKSWAAEYLMHKLFHDKQVIFVSKGAKQELLKRVASRTKLKVATVIYNIVDIDGIRIKANEKCNPEFGFPYIISVARLAAVKQFDKLIGSYNLLCKRGVKENLIIIGDGPDRKKIEQQVNEYKLQDRVFLLGHKENPYPWMKQAKTLVLSSRSEGLGLVLIESLALDTQCVAIDSPGGIREVLVGEQTKLLAKNDIQSLADKIEESIESELVIKQEWLDKFKESNIIAQFEGL